MEHSGFMIALVPDPATAEQLLVTGGEDLSDLHLTLAYCPSEDVTQIQVAQIIAALAELAKSIPPIEAKVSGVGRFQCDGDDEDDKDVLYASVDSPKLPPLHYNVSEILYRYDVPRSTEHGFTPHITLKYLEPGDPADLQLPGGPIDVRFEYLVLRAGEDEVAIELEGRHHSPAVGPEPGVYGPNPLFEAALLESVGPLELQEQQGVLLESTAAVGDKTGSKWRVLLIKAGTSGNRVHYPEKVLREAAPLFEGTKAFADHPGKSDNLNRPERSIRDVVGWYDKVEWSPEQRGLTADFHVLESADWLRQSLMSSWKGGNPTLLGFSINAAGTKSGKLVEGGALLEAITHVRSTDVVTTPGAGGRVLDVLESARGVSELDELRETLDGFRAELMESVEVVLMCAAVRSLSPSK